MRGQFHMELISSSVDTTHDFLVQIRDTGQSVIYLLETDLVLHLEMFKCHVSNHDL